MSNGFLRAALGASALAGAALSGYLTWVHYAGAELICRTGGCETVQTSEYATLLGLPVATLGLAAYVLVAATALSVAPVARAIAASVALAAVAFSAYLIVIQLAVIGEICDWCLANDAIAAVVAAAALLRLISPAGPPTTRTARARRGSKAAASA
jgi:uncharacterized membrane protein